jgi:NAD(P)-dependent dehydrogenase (short-subunit alcohol dehydrogenase family)
MLVRHAETLSDEQSEWPSEHRPKICGVDSPSPDKPIDKDHPVHMYAAAPVVAITGAGRGIGREIALAFAETGARLVLAARSELELQHTRELAAERGAEGIVVLTDVTDPEQTANMARAALEAFGVIDVLVCNSGIAGPTAPLWEIEPEQWRETMRVNVEGVYLCCRYVLPPMLARRHGSIIVIGSMTGKRPLHGRTPYGASKLALVGLVRTLSWETGPYGIRVNLISPGGVRGPRIEGVIAKQAATLDISEEESLARWTSASPLGRLTEAGEVASAAVFLASPAAAGITGEDLNVSAGVVNF